MPLVDVASHRIEYVRIEAGGEQRPTLVFLHEGLGSIAMWREFPERAARETRCDAIVYSRYGYGNSDPIAEPRSVRYMHDEALLALPELLDRLAVERPILVGHSDGASIAIIYAGGSQRDVAGVVLMGMRQRFPDGVVDEPGLHLQHIGAPREHRHAAPFQGETARDGEPDTGAAPHHDARAGACWHASRSIAPSPMSTYRMRPALPDANAMR